MAYQSVPVKGCEGGVCVTVQIDSETGETIGIYEVVGTDRVGCPLTDLRKAECEMMGCGYHSEYNRKSEVPPANTQIVYSEAGTPMGEF